jgi:hypothetical protein
LSCPSSDGNLRALGSTPGSAVQVWHKFATDAGPPIFRCSENQLSVGSVQVDAQAWNFGKARAQNSANTAVCAGYLLCGPIRMPATLDLPSSICIRLCRRFHHRCLAAAPPNGGRHVVLRGPVCRCFAGAELPSTAWQGGVRGARPILQYPHLMISSCLELTESVGLGLLSASGTWGPLG